MWGFWECWSGTVILYRFSYEGLTGLLGFRTLLSNIQNRSQHLRNWICFHLRVEKWGDSAFYSLERAKWFSVWDSCYWLMWFHMMQPAIVLLWLNSKIQTVWSPSGLPQLLHSLTEDAVKLPCFRGWRQRLVHHSLWKILCWQVCFLALYLKIWRGCTKLCMGVKFDHIYWTYEGRNDTDAVLVQGSKGELSGGWRELYIEQLHNWYASPNIMRIISGAGDEMCMHSFSVENVNEENPWHT